MTTYLCECIGVSKSGYYNYLKNENKRIERDNKDQKWQASFFGYKDENHFMCENGCAWFHCIPYEGNEHLLGTTKDVEG